MQKAFELLSAYFNHLALELAKKEYLENQRSIQEKGQLLHGFGNYNSQFSKVKDEAPEEDYYEDSSYSPVDKALQLVDKAYDISRCFGQLTSSETQFLVKSEVPAVKLEETNKKAEFPWRSLNKLNPQSRFAKVQIKKTLTLFYQTHPIDVKRAMEIFNIKPQELNEFKKAEQIRDKRSQLRQQVIAKSNQSQISLNEFKKLARRVYTNKLFRPTDVWCLNFIRKHRIEKRVGRPFV